MIWCLENPERSIQERQALATLVHEVDWLTLHEWRIDAPTASLVVDADIKIGDRSYPVTLRYPQQFPHIPLLVLPRGTAEYWSTHQYGPGGELCLEHGPDNWLTHITGADMLRSAHRLLAGENPAPQQKGRVPSRHAVTLGQTLQNDTRRFVLTRDVMTLVAALPEGAWWTGTCVTILRAGGAVLGVSSIQRAPDDLWIAPGFPGAILAEDGFDRTLAILRLPTDASAPAADSRTALFQSLRAAVPSLPDASAILLIRGDRITAYTVWQSDDSIAGVSVIPAEAAISRVNSEHASLTEREVAIIGCGSLGSKLAVMLARSGVGTFYLVDDDVMMPDNIVRNSLDWRDVGFHKTSALKRQILLVNPLAKVITREFRIGGQTASASLESTLTKVSACDLIIDATAEPQVFNYLAAASSFGKKPMIWAEVFGGGIGGMIARHRPDIEPAPPVMRAHIEHWCYVKGHPVERGAMNYETRERGVPLLADDADVSVIAGHAARLAIDTLMPREATSFPHAVYMIGLKDGLFFHEPFHTEPVPVGEPLVTPPPSLEAIREEVQHLTGLLTKLKNETDSSPSSPEEPPR